MIFLFGTFALKHMLLGRLCFLLALEKFKPNFILVGTAP